MSCLGETDVFHPIDYLFAQKLCPNHPSIFLAYLLKTAREGHLCVSIENGKLFPSLNDSLDAKILEEAATLPQQLFQTNRIVKEDNRYYLYRNWACEQRFLENLQRIRSSILNTDISKQWVENKLIKSGLQPEQQQAIIHVAQHPLTLICGGPGTGKTFTAAKLIELFLTKVEGEIVVVAPTGKATANIRMALGPIAEKCTVKTLHSLLKKPRLYAELILVDEGSMVDAELMAKLFTACPEGARLVLLGDKDQLPPVESGNFFADLANDPTLVATLKTCLRAELKTIVDLAIQVKQGIPIASKPLPDLKALVELILKSGMHVLTPLRKGPYGVDVLNKALFEAHQKQGQTEIPIMIRVNDPTLELFNGDTGVLNLQEKRAYFSPGKSYPESILPKYEYAYVLSVHKSQGSEYDRVMILLPDGSEVFGREMLYTAVTRAKKEVVIFSNDEIMQAVIKNHAKRLSGVTHFSSHPSSHTF